MKRVQFLRQSVVAALMIAAISFAGCKKDDPVKVSGVSLNKTALALTEGGSETLTATVAPDNAENKTVTWTVTGDAATVDQNGKVTAVKAGAATVTVTTDDGGKTATCTVTVNAAVVAVTGVTLDKPALILTVGGSETLATTVAPSDAGDKTVEWTSSDETVATVAEGLVTAVAEGTAVITVTAKDGGFKAECTVTVSEPAKTMTMTTAVRGDMHLGLAGTGEAVIDWGDGSAPETVTLSPFIGGKIHSYPHTFSGTTSRTIVIDGQNITLLYCFGFELTSLNVTKNTALTVLSCFVNQLTSLDVTKNTELIALFCYNNQLTSLDVTKNTALEVLDCNGNRLTDLDVSKNTVLTNLYCGLNQLEAEGLNALFGTLHGKGGTIDIRGNPGTNTCDRSIATKKGWTVNTTDSY